MMLMKINQREKMNQDKNFNKQEVNPNAANWDMKDVLAEKSKEIEDSTKFPEITTMPPATSTDTQTHE